jgi:glutaredoxin
LRNDSSSLSAKSGEYSMSLDVVLYTRAKCCLCDQAKSLLRKHGLNVQEVDIDCDAELHARYTDGVPVVVINGKERFRGWIAERLLQRILQVENGGPS